MIKTLKSELRLRPTYDELVGMIESQGDPNRPPIEQIIDRRATIFRNNQFGSQFDNIDFLGLKKQEEDKLKQEQRNLQLRQTAVNVGTSIGALSASSVSSPPLSYGGQTPDSAYQFGSPDATPRMTLQQIASIQDELLRQQQQQASSNLAEVAQQYLPPPDVEQYTIATDEDLPPLEPIPQEEEEEEEDETIEEPNLYQTNLVYWNNDIEAMRQNPKITYEDLLFQLYMRGQLKETDEKAVNDLPDDLSMKIYLLKIVEQLIGDSPEDNEWQITINDELLRKRKREWKERGKRRRITGKQPPPTETQIASASSSSSTPLRDIAVAGAKAGAQALAKAGAEALAKSFLPV